MISTSPLLHGTDFVKKAFHTHHCIFKKKKKIWNIYKLSLKITKNKQIISKILLPFFYKPIDIVLCMYSTSTTMHFNRMSVIIFKYFFSVDLKILLTSTMCKKCVDFILKLNFLIFFFFLFILFYFLKFQIFFFLFWFSTKYFFLAYFPSYKQKIYNFFFIIIYMAYVCKNDLWSCSLCSLCVSTIVFNQIFNCLQLKF